MRPAINYSNAVAAQKYPSIQTASSTWNGKGIDYDTRLRFVNVGGVRYWEHGAFDVLHGGHRNPDGRKGMSQLLGTECVKSNEYKGKLFTPEGLEVRKTQLVDNPVLWVDREHDMVVNASYYNPLKYACQSSPPIPQRKLKVAFPDKKADKEKWPEIKQWIEWVNAQRNLGGECPNMIVYRYSGEYQTTIGNWMCRPAQPYGKMLYFMWKYPIDTAREIRKYFLQQNNIIREYPWLKTTKPA